MPTGEVWDKIYSELLSHITNQGSECDRGIMAAELLTPTERIMLSKRLAIICMLGEGYTFEDIQETLRVSPSTIGRIWTAMQKGKYKRIVAIVRKRKVFDILAAVLPRAYTSPRWSWLK